MNTTEAAKTPKCRCGNALGHHMVSDEPVYTFVGWFAILIGISARPTRIKYRCRRCQEVFHQTTDPAVLAKHY